MPLSLAFALQSGVGVLLGNRSPLLRISLNSCATLPAALRSNKIKHFLLLFLPFALALHAQIPPPAATLYVSTGKGVETLSASAAGVVKVIAGPHAVSGSLIGGTRTNLIVLGTYYVRNYSLNANGTIHALVANADTQSYSGAQCGTTAGATFDPRGYVYVQLANATDSLGNNICDALQTYKVTPNGLVFEGATVYDESRFASPSTLPAVSTAFAFNLFGIEDACEDYFNILARETSGTLNVINAAVVEPTPDPAGGGFFPIHVAADSTNHLAVAMVQDFAAPCGPMGPTQLASFTVNAQGSIASTNTYLNMPTTMPDIEVMKIDPTGKLLVIAGDGVGAGLMLFHFNGSAPITPYTSNLLPGAGINSAGFDRYSHLYAGGIGVNSGFKVFSFYVTPQDVTMTRAPVVVPVAMGATPTMIVVPR